MENTNTRVAPPPGPLAGGRTPYLMIISGQRVGDLHKLTAERTIVGRGPSAELRLEDTGISREHAELVVAGGRLRVRDLGSTNGTFCNGERSAARDLHDGDKVSIGGATLLVFTYADGIERAYDRERSRSAMRDATSALRREAFVAQLGEEVSYSRRHAAPLALLLFELDGYAAAEQQAPATLPALLTAAARRAAGALREDDVLGAFGPGRFAVACRETSATEARDRALALRAALASAPLEAGSMRSSFTVSVGLACCPPGSDRGPVAAAALLRAAEGALTVARAQGGDRVELAPGADA